MYFIYFWLHWVFLALCSLSLAAAGGATLCCSAQASHCGGFSWCGAQLLGPLALGVAEHGLRSYGLRALGFGLSSCGARAYLLHGMWNPPGPGIKPMFPAAAGRFLSTVPPGKSSVESFNVEQKKENWAKILDYGYRLDRGLAGKESTCSGGDPGLILCQGSQNQTLLTLLKSTLSETFPLTSMASCPLGLQGSFSFPQSLPLLPTLSIWYSVFMLLYLLLSILI